MPTLLVLYPGYGTTSCARVARYAERIGDLRLALADKEPTTARQAVDGLNILIRPI